jgi:hypothetical protein
MQVEDKNHRVELDQKCRMQMAKFCSVCEIGNTESFSLVAPSCFGLADKKRSVRPSATQRKICHLSSLGKKNFTKICKELTEGFAMN